MPAGASDNTVSGLCEPTTSSDGFPDDRFDGGGVVRIDMLASERMESAEAGDGNIVIDSLEEPMSRLLDKDIF
jgi:hypothetical protein